MSNPNQLLLLADHIKLSLLEKQRAESLGLPANPSSDKNIASSLDSLQAQLSNLSSKPNADFEALTALRSQYEDLYKQFHGTSSPTVDDTLTQPNNAALAQDFTKAQQIPHPQIPQNGRSTRFKDDPSQHDFNDEANRNALFNKPYTDEPEQPPDPTTEMDNQQIHAYHEQVMAEQDEQLDTLSQSIGRQRYLGMQISDELEGQIELLDDVDAGVDRHQTRLDGAKRRLNGVSKKAKDNWGMTTIIILIVVLVLLIVVFK